jgi:two-component system sensor kinase FixL
VDSSEKAPASSDLTPVVSQGEEQFQRVFAEAPIGMALFDSEYRFVLVNRALAQMLDTTEEALMGASCESILQPDEAAGQRLLAERLLGREVQGYKVQRRYPSGSRPERFADVTVTRIDTEDGGVLGLEMIEDITEARRAKEQTRVHEAELAHATRLAMLGEMVAGIAHEVNQPLAAIVNYANGSTRRLQSGDVQDMRVIQDALSRIASEAMRASEIVRSSEEPCAKRIGPARTTAAGRNRREDFASGRVGGAGQGRDDRDGSGSRNSAGVGGPDSDRANSFESGPKCL